MGAISGEELLKWEKMQGLGACEEKILVLVRLRPLSEKEAAANEVADWECINDTTILYRNTLREGSTFPSAYTFDRVYRGDCSTREVYEEGSRGIALSVVSGINSSIFAYGQTSSGKTYTMNGITELTVADIFDYICKHEERAFVLKFSAIEIYNEVVRDLLSPDNTSLRLLDDPERGTVVEKVTEETLRDWNHFNELVSICEAQRQIGETLLNERSSRSHQILKLTVESSAREFLGKDNSTTLSASVNFVDLAGSERASQALSAGARLKEGCHINRSLLTLGTVIRKLSKGRHGHINYRDSKLTRILQPALGGNARTAIICTLSPARSHVEQTRNTLLFACCAKEVTTKAQVNVVMSDKALVKHLQKELARLENELRAPGPVSSNCDYIALLKKKDLQIEKMDKEIRDLKKQRDVAQSRTEELLKFVENYQDPKKLIGNGHQSNGKTDDTWEDDCSLSEGITYSHSLDSSVRKTNRTIYHNKMNGNNSEQLSNSIWENTEEHSEAEYTYSPPSVGQGYDDYCKDVQCVDMEVLSRENDIKALSSPLGESAVSALRQVEDHDGTSQTSLSTTFNENGERSHIQNHSRYGALEESLHDVQRTIEPFISPHGDTSPRVPAADNSSSTNLKLSRSLSCRANLVTGSSSPNFEEADINATPPNESERIFPGRPEAFQRKFLPLNYDNGIARLSRNNSQSSLESGSVAQSVSAAADEDLTSVHTFVSGLKEMASAYEKQLADEQGAESRSNDCESNVKEVASEALTNPLDWPPEFERKQRSILGLWQICNVPLVHRTYFFLLFRGDPADSIYMEVELRRLTFLKETFSSGGQAVADGRVLTPASSLKALHREREKLSKLMRRRLSEADRERLFQKWGISLESKRRRLQLASRLWSDTEDIDRVMESASVVAKLVRFEDQGKALRGMLGLSFSSPSMGRRSHGWRQRSAISYLG
ncbi:kinesin-like protein KIN-7E isoform X1 [Rhodamnia argentea]|uniref:Kinesin-like protein n=2 Tax=Rhodamnia argentea TaxID=178133 RepID=A0A8B8NL87_9MYRT|nr:kinesin-like protein KIN-7E isoform X1 [Rhodamnia argentea]XP_048128159.1 kinesin-like protein KIN-7E isoform X1 [Rhodamnia argentea]